LIVGGLAFLFNYGALFLVPCWALFFLLWRPARVHLKFPGPWLALLLLLLGTAPVIVWNWQHDWMGVQYFTTNPELQRPQARMLRNVVDFTVNAAGLWNPIVFAGTLLGGVLCLEAPEGEPLWLYFFAMGAPVFFGYWLCSVQLSVRPGWIVPAVIPLVCLTVAYWYERWRQAGAPLNHG
jgi:4-amino-4-deoxy-L-arabinose transferase-like glycosyltransferase